MLTGAHDPVRRSAGPAAGMGHIAGRKPQLLALAVAATAAAAAVSWRLGATSRRFGSYRSVWSLYSASSVLSIGSAASVLSVGSFASLLSIASSNSVLSLASDGGFLSINASRRGPARTGR